MSNLPENTLHSSSDENIIVFLHGFLSSKTYWKKLSKELTSIGYTTITIDLLGFGDAPKPDTISYTYDDHLHHIKTTIDNLKLTQKYTLMGHSMGALLALKYGNQYQSEIERLVLTNPPAYTNTEQAKTTLRNTNAIYRLLLDSRFRHNLWILLRVIGPIAKHTKQSREGSLKNVIERASFFSDLGRNKLDTLVIVGKKDRQIYTTNIMQQEFHKNIKIIFENSGHHTAITHSRSLAKKIEQMKDEVFFV